VQSLHNRLLSGIFQLPVPLRDIILTIPNNIIDIIIRVIIFHALLSCTSGLQLVSAQEQIRLEAVTDQGTFKVQIIWTSNAIGSANMFEVHFFDLDTGSEIEDVKYDISVYREDKLEIQRPDQVSMFQEIFFEDVGSYEIRINDVEDLGERTTIPIQVTPEFGLELSILYVIAVGIGMLAVRANSNNLFRRATN
jgi:hypothetical protein